jgi:hypothetical protein
VPLAGNPPTVDTPDDSTPPEDLVEIVEIGDPNVPLSSAPQLTPPNSMTSIIGAALLALALAIFLAARRSRTVTFYVDGEQYGEPQKVTYGSAATDPAPIKLGSTFSGWDKEFDKVKKDLDVYGTFEDK